MATVLQLTAAGQAKITRFLTAARQEASAAVGYAAVELKSAVADAAPSPDEEGRLLSQGTGQRGVGGLGFGLGIFGTPDGGRFLREGAMVSLREAIQTDPIVSKKEKDKEVAGFGNPTRINALTGFSWQTRKRGIVGPTLPFNKAYVQALEYGGPVWRVVPRPENRGALEPEDGKISQVMYKTLAPRRMFRGTMFLRQAQLKARMAREIRQAAKAAS